VSHVNSASPRKALVRVMTCGSVDDGKSTLLGRLLHDAGLLPDDQIAAARHDSAGRPASPEGIDMSLLFDGLEAEREQGITIDVAYRYFQTGKAAFVLADAPGHEQYTRNMATAASVVDAAMLVIDATKGLSRQTARHLNLLATFRVANVAIIINKMDAVGYDETRFGAIRSEIEALAGELDIARIAVIPASALIGDNVSRPGTTMPWYRGPSVMAWLEAPQESGAESADLRFAVQYVSRSDTKRYLHGMIVSGAVAVGERILVQPSGLSAEVDSILHKGERVGEACAGQTIGLSVADLLDIGRGSMISTAHTAGEVAQQLQCKLLWLGAEPLVAGRNYLASIGTARVVATITAIKYKVDVLTNRQEPARSLEANDIGVVNIAFDRPVAFDTYAQHRATGGLILIDRLSKATCAAGVILHSLRRSQNLRWQSFDVDRETRAALLHQIPSVIWFTGLSGSGKSTIANQLMSTLMAQGRLAYVLDGDNLRHGLSCDLGFTEPDRVENIRRAAEVARLMADAGLIVIVALISPFARDRAMARERVGDIPFFEIFVDTPLDECEARDPKGLYVRARRGEIPNFTGISAAYEPPANPDLRVATTEASVDMIVETIIARLAEVTEG